MANIASALNQVNFRYLPNINSLSDEVLKTHGYYRGYPCAHRHCIRDIDNHWCYHCAIKIKSNICGFNMNFIHQYYNYKYEKLWEKVTVGEPDECWDTDLPGTKSPKRLCFPSYRSFHTGRASENVSLQKLIYQCAWGDVGALVVSRVCGNPWCSNPLHLVSSWNIGLPPKTINPFILDFRPETLMLLHKAITLGREQEVIESYYRQTIKHPLSAPEPPYYDEG